MSRSGLTYGLDARPPLPALLLCGLQHVAVITVIGMVFPLLVAERAGADAATRETVMGISMIAMAAGTVLQCFRWGPIGSGFLLPPTLTAAYMSASLKAAEQGGLPLVFGMTIFAGLCVVVLSQLVHRLRPYLPAEIAGLAVVIIGITLGTLGFRLVFGGEAPTPADGGPGLPRELVGVVVLTVTIGLTVWAGGTPKLLAVLIGFLAGCATAAALGLVTLPPWMFELGIGLRVPIPLGVAPTFEASLVPEFLVAALACSLRAMGDITTAQKINDPAWKRQDIHTVQRGLLADGLTTMLAGALGTVGLNTSSSSIGVSAATGVTARRVGIAVAIILVILAVTPRPRVILAGLPLEVAGGVLMFSACFIIVNGIRIIMSRMLDARRTILVSLSLVFGLSHDLYPALYAGLPPPLRGMFGSDLVVAMVTAIVLNLLFRIGVARRARLMLSGRSDPDLPYAFMQQHGGEWGARPDVVAKVTAALVEFREHADELMAPGDVARVAVRYDEYAIGVEFRYRGTVPPLADGVPLPAGALMSVDPDAAAGQLRLLLLARLADRARTDQQGAEAVLRLHFEH